MHILTDSVYNEGAYASFEEFIQNKPSILNFEMVLMEGNRVKFVKAGSNSQPVVLDVWGICQKGYIYKYHEWNLIPIEKQGTGFIISNYAENTNKVNRKLFFTALGASQAGAIVGGVMYYQAHADAVSRQLVVKSIPYITDPNKRPVATCIDMETGDFSF